MPTREEAQALARRLHGLAQDAEILRKAAARDLAGRHPVDATEMIHLLLELAREGWEPSSSVLSGYVAALDLELANIPHAGSLRRLATVQNLGAVANLLADGEPMQQMDPGAAAKADAKAMTQSLGHLKQKARITRDPDELSRLAMVSNPAVVRNALLNPMLTEPLVVRIAARRPARPEPLEEIWRSPRWSRSAAVRRALALNPYLPPEIGTKLVPLLTDPDLEEIVQDAGLHPALRELSWQLLSQMSPRPNPRLQPPR